MSPLRRTLPKIPAPSGDAAGRETEEQLVAANIDVVFIVFGLDVHVKPNAIERYLVLARRSGATAVVVLNKCDLEDDIEDAQSDAETAAAGAPVHLVSTRTGVGMNDLEAYLSSGRTVARADQVVGWHVTLAKRSLR